MGQVTWLTQARIPQPIVGGAVRATYPGSGGGAVARPTDHDLCGSFNQLSVIWFREPKLLNLIEIANSIVDLGDFFRIELKKDIT